jgi:hypothetical protein
VKYSLSAVKIIDEIEKDPEISEEFLYDGLYRAILSM